MMDAQRLTTKRAAIRTLLRDNFNTDRAAGAVHGTAPEPGPGPLRWLADAENKISIAAGKAEYASGKAVPTYADPGLYYDQVFPRRAGQAFLSVQTAGGGEWTAGLGTVGTNPPCFYMGWGIISVQGGGTWVESGAFTVGQELKLVYVQRPAGGFYLAKGAGYAEWTLLMPQTVETPGIGAAAVALHDSSLSLDKVRVVNLPGPWDKDYGIATGRLAGAVGSGVGFQHEPDAVIEFTVTALPNAGTSAVIYFRRADGINCWQLFIADTGFVALVERVNSVDTTRASFAGLLAGQRVVMAMEGNTIKVWANDVLKFTYAAAENFQTAIAGSIWMGAGTAISDLVCWPRKIRGAAATLLERMGL